MHDWKNNLDQFFGGDFWNEFEHMIKPPIPAINLYEHENELICYINLPGIKNSKQVELLVDGYSLEIKGELFPIKPAGKAVKQELLHGEFSRQIDLPFPVRSDKISATLQHGLMKVQLHRNIEKNRRKKRIEIKDAEE